MKEEKWINIGKALAIIAVLVDHTKGILYTSDAIQKFSFYSVPLFILLSGYTFCISVNKRNENMIFIIKKSLIKIFIPYCIATFIYQLIAFREFQFSVYLKNITTFSMSGPFYFVFLYCQIIIVAPILYKLAKIAKNNIMIHTLIIISLLIYSVFSINFTNICDIYVGILFGGTYLVMFYIGILIYIYRDKLKNINNMVCFSIFAILTLFWYTFYFFDRLSLDSKIPFGNGMNPPSITIGVLTILLTFFIFYLINLLEKMNKCKYIIDKVSIIGKNSIYIFLYHRFFLDYILVPSLGQIDNMWIKRLFFYPIILFMPVFVGYLLKKINSITKSIYIQRNETI